MKFWGYPKNPCKAGASCVHVSLEAGYGEMSDGVVQGTGDLRIRKQTVANMMVAMDTGLGRAFYRMRAIE